jgi:hypothetical protein
LQSIASKGWYIPRAGQLLNDADDAADGDLSFSVHLDDEMTTVMGRLALSVVGHRLRRSLWFIRIWPARTVRLLTPAGGVRDACLKDLKADFVAFNKFKEEAENFVGLRDFTERSIFQLLCDKQITDTLEMRRWELDGTMLQWLAKTHNVHFASSTCEEAFHVMKSSSRKHANRLGKEHRMWHSLVEACSVTVSASTRSSCPGLTFVVAALWR